ncbi:head GIN domain-containing protein [Hanstruepera ponticola]|uniref:head GIN domain-containing protein n=1 Tax=Hanstruepera ponticola TaxID=2042995 RepID=UPI0017856C9E|nr:head GIN domain-containing protein [Hanstruepera ponticola]
MKNKILLTVFLLSAISFSCAQSWKKVSGNGNVTTINRTTSDYDAISCAGSFDYILVSGTEGQLKIEGEENLLKHVITEVKNGKLVVKTERGINLKTSMGKTITVTIPFRDINAVSLSGSGDLWTEDTISTTSLDVSLAGSGDMKLDIKATSVESSIAGSGDIDLKGKTTNLEVSIAGSGDYSGFGLEADNTEVSISGSGNAEVVSNLFIKARISGSGDVEYKGNPDKEDTKVSGSGSVSSR